MKDEKKSVLQALGWPEPLIDEMLDERADLPFPVEIDDVVTPTVVSSSNVPFDPTELNLTTGAGIVFKPY